jgi:hypothetical protein
LKFLSGVGVTSSSDPINEPRPENTQTAELIFAVKSTPAKIAVNVDFFTARLKAQRSSNFHNVTKNLIKTVARNILLKDMNIIFRD